ncbi:MAG: hypothetical protein QGH97_14865, partial [Dehalococcoidia bacterium]|nr:hypothetical protein [Dehalococcoidia bacterium]
PSSSTPLISRVPNCPICAGCQHRKILDILAAERGRDPASLSISVFGQPTDTTREQVEDFLNAGAERVSVWAAHCETEEEMAEQLERMADALVR